MGCAAWYGTVREMYELTENFRLIRRAMFYELTTMLRETLSVTFWLELFKTPWKEKMKGQERGLMHSSTGGLFHMELLSGKLLFVQMVIVTVQGLPEAL